MNRFVGTSGVGAIGILFGLGCLILFSGPSCTLVYTGCEADGDCNVAIGETCVKWSENEPGECGFADAFCDEGSTRECEAAAFDGDGMLRGACVGKMQECVGGAWVPCALPDELCNGVDDNCNGAIDDGVDGVNVACDAGIGACLVSGQTVCNADGTIMCNAVAAEPTAASCDCVDNNCDDVINDFTTMPAGMSTVTAGADSWSVAVSGATSLAAYEDPMAPGTVSLVNLTTGMTTGSFAGRSPRIIESETNGFIVFYIDDDMIMQMPPDPPLPFAEIYYRTVDSMGVAGMPTCLTCDEQGRQNDGEVATFDAVYSGCSQITDSHCNDGIDNDGDGLTDIDDPECDRSFLTPSEDGTVTYCNDNLDNDKDRVTDAEDAGCLDTDSESSCGYLIVFARADQGTVHSGRIYEKTHAIQPSSVGPLLPAAEIQGVERIRIAMNSPASAYFALLRNTAGTYSVDVVLALATSLTQTQNSGAVVTAATAGTEFDIASYESSNTALLAWTDATGVQLVSITPDPAMGNTPGFTADVGPVNIVPGGGSPEIEFTCAERALLVTEVGVGMVGATFVDPATLMMATSLATPLTGASPRLVLDTQGNVTAGTLVGGAAGNGAPSAAAVVCDP